MRSITNILGRGLVAGLLAFGVCQLLAIVQKRAPGGIDIRQQTLPIAPAAIYSANPEDSWNRIFRLLFTRTIEARVSADFPEAAPFGNVIVAMGTTSLRVSTRVFPEIETGDRAIDPLYPSFLTNAGPLEVYREPNYSQLLAALHEALSETSERSPLARALMQSDVWAAYDLLLSRLAYRSGNDRKPANHSNELLNLLGDFIRKLALEPREISNLPSNYRSSDNGLPDIFTDANWIEIQLMPNRLHDVAFDFRRATRVFVRPLNHEINRQLFVESLKGNVSNASKVEAVALITQDLLIDATCRVVPSPIVFSVQIRNFKDTSVREFELSRKLLLSEPAGGGFIQHDENARAYQPEAGNDYSFATRIAEAQAAVVVKLKTKCSACHGNSLQHLITYSLHEPPALQPPVTILNAAKNERALMTASLKEQRADFKSLARSWSEKHDR